MEVPGELLTVVCAGIGAVGTAVGVLYGNFRADRQNDRKELRAERDQLLVDLKAERDAHALTRASILDRLDVARRDDKANGDLVARLTTDVAVAHVRIQFLEEQIQQLETQLADCRCAPNPAEETRG